MQKRLLKAAIITALSLTFAAPAFAAANPFTDVPANHWAYGAVTKLAEQGIVEGTGDHLFRGDRPMTRYEMAQIVAKAMTKTLTPEQQASLDRLEKEFAPELNSMGIKVDGIAQQLNDMVKISGDAQLRYFNAQDLKVDSNGNSVNDVIDYRARVAFDGKINPYLRFNARVSTGDTGTDIKSTNPQATIDSANVSFNILDSVNTIGRQDIKLGSGYLMDTQMNGFATQIGGLKLFTGHATQTSANPAWQTVYGGEYALNINGVGLTADYMKNDTNKDEFYGANLNIPVGSYLSVNGEYFKNNNNGGSEAKAYGVRFDKLGLAATYRDVQPGAFTAFSGMNANTTDIYADLSANGFKGMEYQFDHSLMKNLGLTLKYQTFKDQNDNQLNDRASAVVSVKF